MTRRDYLLIAAALKRAEPQDGSHHGDAAREQWAHTCAVVADSIRVNNAAFDVPLFLTNCGVQS